MTAVAARTGRPTVAARPPVPREHGAWGILLIPFVTAVGVARTWNLPVALLLGSVLCFYVARTSFLRRNFRWTMILLAGSAGAAAPLLFVWNLWWLVAFGAVGAALGFRKTDKSWAGELTAVGGLTLTAPAAWYVATGALNDRAFWLWVFNALYFAGGVFHVKMHVGAALRRKEFTGSMERMRFAAANLGYHVMAMGLVALVHPVVALAFVPALARAVLGAATLSPVLRIKRLGWTEVAYSLVFAALVVYLVRP